MLYLKKVFQSAIMEAKKFKASGGDALADVLDLLSHKHSGLEDDDKVIAD